MRFYENDSIVPIFCEFLKIVQAFLTCCNNEDYRYVKNLVARIKPEYFSDSVKQKMIFFVIFIFNF